MTTTRALQLAIAALGDIRRAAPGHLTSEFQTELGAATDELHRMLEACRSGKDIKIIGVQAQPAAVRAGQREAA